MIFPSKNYWNKHRIGNDLHRFFVLLWSVDPRTPDTWQPRTANLRTVLREIASAAEISQDYPPYRHNLPFLIDEAVSLADHDPVASRHFLFLPRYLGIIKGEPCQKDDQSHNVENVRQKAMVAHGNIRAMRFYTVTDLRDALREGNLAQAERVNRLTMSLATHWCLAGYSMGHLGEPGPIPWADNTAMGHPPKWGPGGEMSYRLSNGNRVNQWGPIGGGGGRRRNGKPVPSGRPSHQTINQWGHSYATGDVGGSKDNPTCGKPRPSHRLIATIHRDGVHTQNTPYAAPVKANPGTLIRTKTGGGNMGSKLCHENEAPFPEALAEFFIRSFCPPGGIVLDVFSGSGTTACVAERFGRRGIGSDLRWNQCELGARRLAERREKESSIFHAEVA